MKKGVLPDWRIKELIKQGVIPGADLELVNTSSLDLRVGHERWKLLGSFLPLPGQRIEDILGSRDIVDEFSQREHFYFDCSQQYVMRLVESLDLPRSISAKVFNKSGRGRIGISLRSLTDSTPQFDIITNGYKGNVFAEISSTVFPLVIHSGQTTMPQIRFYEGDPEPIAGSELELLLRTHPILTDDGGKPTYNERERESIIGSGKLIFTADIPEEGLLAYTAKRDKRTLDLSKKDHYDPEEYYQREIRRGKGKGILVHPGDFILIISKQNIRLPPFIAAEVDEYSTQLGDMKAHYAGLINASHGYDPDGSNTPSRIVFEIRARDTPIIIQDNQPLARFSLYKMWEEPEQRYMGRRSTDFADLRSVLPDIFKKD